MTRVARKRMHHRVRDVKRSSRTRARTKDLDQIHEDLKAPEKLLNQPIDPDLPGLGQFYCVECSRHFTSNGALVAHQSTKLHRKRLKVLKEEPYTQKEAEAAVGLGTDNGRSLLSAKESDEVQMA
ncbi:hypothetical protein HDU76_000028 [Blyttiomyces sp. JEL0837]|nr:hypothetical protein HDU76_000028 [Blyttiomyces sp. JEL0837]